MKIALQRWGAVQGHTLSFNHLNLKWLRGVTWLVLDRHLMPVEMYNRSSETQKRFSQRNFHVHFQVISISSENRMWHLSDYCNDITGHDVRVGVLLGFAFEHDRRTVLHTSLDHRHQGLALTHDSSTIASRTNVLGLMALTTTGVAWLLHLHAHIHELLDHNVVTSSLAYIALDAFAILSTRPTAGWAEHVALDVNGGLLTLVQLFQRNSQVHHDVWALGTMSSEGRVRSLLSLLKTLDTVHVIDLALLLV